MTKETLEQKLKQLMGETLDKSSYRRAALKYHPDRNNGDGSKMSELNSLWSVYNA
jgi:curved DNA-binding protein CbpA